MRDTMPIRFASGPIPLPLPAGTLMEGLPEHLEVGDFLLRPTVRQVAEAPTPFMDHMRITVRTPEGAEVGAWQLHQDKPILFLRPTR